MSRFLLPAALVLLLAACQPPADAPPSPAGPEPPAAAAPADVPAAPAATAPAALTVAAKPERPALAVETVDHGPFDLAAQRGQWVVVNFWATWCAPCRHEMPGLDRLNAEMGGEDFAVVTVATGRNAVPGIRKFFAEAEVTTLPGLRDPKSALARKAGVMGLPVTLVLNPEGQEVARLIGDAEWDAPEAKAALAALMAGG